MKTLLKIVCIIVLVLTLATAVLFGIIALKSPGKTPPITGANSVAALEQVELGGLKQWVLMRSHDVNNPVLLILQGGPGSPETAMVRQYNSLLEKYFTVVNWEQRGAGKSFSADIPKETMTINSFVSDADELVQYLKKRFKKDKIYLEGHSWGSALGALLVQKSPGDFKAYIGIGQASNMMESEILGYDWVLAEAEKRKDKKALDELKALGGPPCAELEKIGVERKYVMMYGGTIHEDPAKLLMAAFINCGEYTLEDKFVRFAKGSMFSLKAMLPELCSSDLMKATARWKVPVYIIAGKYDMTVNYSLQKKYFDHIKAPKKEFFTFENSAHMCAFEEPAKYMDIMVNTVLKENGR